MVLENGVLEINVSKDKLNYTQLNNKYVHLNESGKKDVSAISMCNVTSICQSLDYNGWSFPKGKFDQPEDNLAEFIMTNSEVLDFYKKNEPYSYQEWKAERPNSFSPVEIHSVLAFGVNKWLGKEVDTFELNANIWDITKEILNNRSCVISGAFPTENGGVLNHIVSLVGCIWNFNKVITKDDAVSEVNKNKILPDTFIIDDTYARWNMLKKVYEYNKSGNDTKLTYKDFIDIMKPVRSQQAKYCHFLKSVF